MKDILKKIFDKKIATPVFVGAGTFAIFTFIVFPGLTVANTMLNIISALFGIFTLIYLFYYLSFDKFFGDMINELEPGETELDYIPKEEVEKIIKKTTKRKPKKSEFPMEPHHTPKKKK
jgi:hypothetical protein